MMRKAVHSELLVEVLHVYTDHDMPLAVLIYEDGSTGVAKIDELTFLREVVTYTGYNMTITGELIGFFQSGDSDSTEPVALIKAEDGQLRECSAYKCKVEVVPCE